MYTNKLYTFYINKWNNVTYTLKTLWIYGINIGKNVIWTHKVKVTLFKCAMNTLHRDI